MQRLWSAGELGERWTLGPEELELLAELTDAGKLGLAAQQAYWRQHRRFPNEEADLAPAVVGHLAAQVGVEADALDGYDWTGRTGRRHRRLILDHLAVTAFDDTAEARFRRGLADELLPRELVPSAMDAEISGWFAGERVGRPGACRLGRILRSARATHDNTALQRVADRLDAGLRARLDALLPDQVKRFRRRAAVESAWELRRHPERIRLALLAFWCAPREAEVVDGLVELLIQVTHRITVKAERRVLEELVEEAVAVRGKAGILFRVAEAAVGTPEGVVREVIFPAAGEHTLEALVREARALGTPQSRRVYTALRASYGSYYRRMMPKLLAALDFRSNNGAHRPLLDALGAIRRAEGEGRQYFCADEVAIEGVIRRKWRDVVLEDAPGGGQRVNRINYEICALQTLRERLRCKEA